MGSSTLQTFSWIERVNKESLKADVMAGITGAVIGIPQAVAFAFIAGLPPIYGLYTAMVACPLAAFFGSSWQMVSGPTTAISIVLFSVVSGLADPGSAEFVKMAFSVTLLAGFFQLCFGLAKLGSLVNFVPHSVIVGFTAGAGVLIAGKQLPLMFGVDVRAGASLVEILYMVAYNLEDINKASLFVAAETLLIAAVLKFKLSQRKPHMLFAMILGSLIAYIIGGEQLGISYVEPASGGFPSFSPPDWSWLTVNKVAPGALTVAILGLIEAVAISKSLAASSGQRINGNQEFVGQGIANFVGSFFGSFAGSGSFTRSAINYQSGAETPLAAILASVIIAFLVVFFGSVTGCLPIPAMAGIIVLVGFGLVDGDEIVKIFRISRFDAIVLSTTFFATVLINLEFGIYLGIILSLVFYLQKTAKPLIRVQAPDPEDPTRRFFSLKRKPNLVECPQLKIIRIDGALYYGAVEHVSEYFSDLDPEEHKHILIIFKGLTFIDIEAADWLAKEASRWKESGGNLFVSGLQGSVEEFLKRGDHYNKIGSENFYTCKIEAIAKIYERLDRKTCENCSKRIFNECMA